MTNKYKTAITEKRKKEERTKAATLTRSDGKKSEMDRPDISCPLSTFVTRRQV